MEWLPLISLAGAGSSFALGLAGLLLSPRKPVQWLLAVGLLLLGGESLCQRWSYQAVAREEMLLWQTTSECLVAFQPAVWLIFSLLFARGDPGRHIRQWRPTIALLGICLPALVLIFRGSLVPDAKASLTTGNWFFPAVWPAKLLRLGVLLGAVLVLTNLEWTFRAAVGTSRWRVKYAVIGLGLLFGTRIYTSSQALLYSGSNFQISLLNSAALFLSTLLIALSFYRSKLAAVDIYPSATALYKSLTIVIAGLYLFVVGIVAWLVTSLGGERSFPLLTFLLLIAAVGLSILWLSDRFRQAAKEFVRVHFQRPLHDYRSVWSSFTRRTAAQLDRGEFCRAMARLIAETFEALSVTVWLLDPARGRLMLATSTSLTGESRQEPVEATALLSALASLKTDNPQPVYLEQSEERWCQLLRQSNPLFFSTGGSRVCMPLVGGGEPLGFLVLGDRIAGASFTPEDLDLLKCLGEQAGATLHTLNLSEQLGNAREMEAFQAMSAFLVHDLKNTASTLTLMLRNMGAHYDKPGFREDALRGLTRSVEHVNDLIARLTTLRQKLEIRKTPCELRTLVETAIRNLGSTPDIEVQQEHQPLPQILVDPPQMESVLTNLLLNAREAISGPGTITLQTEARGPWALITVADTGSGMAPEFMAARLFKPFQTTKKKGLGIGMFQAKTIVEAHGGRIEAQSTPGEGSTFRVWLPLPGMKEIGT